jgi:lipoate-protein ligase A
MSIPLAYSPCRLLIDEPLDGAWNMAVDEALLESAATTGQCSLRFYRWSRPTLSLGYFQHHAERAAHSASRDCNLVRRQTGGGSILHDRELTYSLVVPQTHPLASDSARLYRLVHEALQSVLAGWDVQATICANSPRAGSGEQPFLCFQRRAVGDMLLGSAKICGSAQRRRRGAVLQHGSLLLAQSPFAPELPGILELTGKPLDAAALGEQAADELAGRLEFDSHRQGLLADEVEGANCLVSRKYAERTWTFRR